MSKKLVKKKITDNNCDIFKVRCIEYVSDWFQEKLIEINLNEWAFFTVDYRGENHWCLIAHKTENDKWIQKEFGCHGICRNDLVDFIVMANKHNRYQKCKVSRFNNLHYYGNFYEELSKLLNAVSIKTSRKRGVK